jgi:hypothetical protein
MAIVDTLYHRNPDRHVEGWLPPEELLRRIADRFPLAVIDRERGDRRVREHRDRLAEVGAAQVILDDWRAMEGRVAYITIRDRVGGPQFEFLIRARPTSLEIEYERPEDREVCRPLLEALAATLAEYDIQSEDIVDEDLDD